ncbi:GNAT family N-acetyltransferase [Amycolatopsis rubida]|uniref:GNAT family N-acetyltransferase n=1 Tax=Amycolatopsis rubida TaxID=112413 RepID=A0ABX0C405_9PSEU|nr:MULTISPECIES: GNAT family N-acetyltransferase [Amycolatopsis]MYW97481.1 GNAT family N-acetyltransferase [Amycolatopsis rubida]NEC62466.1 GNAT family N-acetyltransferase [Amycolatopsis rubida]OAP22253.1 Acetyltransferase (GNAT) family protein [Amycolatopsis sp. M39]
MPDSAPGCVPLSAETFEQLFGPGGVRGGCWCAFFRLAGPDFKAAGREGRKGHVRTEAQDGKPLRFLGIVDGEPLGWVAVPPRKDNPRLARSRVMASDEPGAVWSITCFYIHRRGRRRGLATALLRAGVDYAVEEGVEAVEGYPVSDGTRSAADLYHGTTGMFADAAFEVVEKRGPARALVRRRIPVAR